MKNFLKAIAFLLLIVTIYLSATIIPGMIIGILVSIQHAEEIAASADPNVLITNAIGPYSIHIMIFAALSTLFMIWLFFLGRKDPLLTYIKWRKISFTDALFIGSLGVFLNILFIALLNYAAFYLPIEELLSQYDELISLALDTNFFMILLGVVFVAPIFEEILIRGIIFNDFRKATPVWLALIIQAVIFGLLHMNIIQGSYAFFLGLILGLLYLKYKSIIAPILLHLTFNLTSTLVSSFMPEIDIYMSTVFVIGLLGSGFITWLLYRHYDVVNYSEAIEIPDSALEENALLARDQ